MTLVQTSNGTGDHDSPTGAASRFAARWHLIGAGLSNLWRFGDLELPAASGRLLLRGANGTGKTTALEALVPYLLDLNAARMSAGKARTTTLSSLMREGAVGKRRHAYAWLTLAERHEGVWSFGVRIQYSEGASPPVKVIPFCVRGRPLHELLLYGPARAALTTEQFTEAVTACEGQTFEDEDAYTTHLAARLFGSPNREDVAMLAGRLRQVRNPTLLGDVSPQAAADALRESLPGVADDVIAATSDALDESDATREAFTRDRQAAEVLEDFRDVWCAHAADVVTALHESAVEADDGLRSQTAQLKTLLSDLTATAAAACDAKDNAERINKEISTAETELTALENQQDYRDAGRLTDLKRSATAKQQTADAECQLMRTTAQNVANTCKSLERELEHIGEDLEEQRNAATTVLAGADDGTRLLTWTLRPRPMLRAGHVEADPGPEMIIHGDGAGLRRIASSWQSKAQEYTQKSEDAALAIVDYRTVEQIRKDAAEREQAARDAEVSAETAATDAGRAEVAAQEAALRLLSSMGAWTARHPQLTAARRPGVDDEATLGARESPWSLEDVEQLAGAEASQVLAASEGWAQHAVARAESLAGELRARAKQHIADASRLRGESRALGKEAEALRSGRLLPLPRPAWAGDGDDTAALGAALDWHEHFADVRTRALLEAALAASGVLGASLGHGGASTAYWRVEPTGPMMAENLSTLIAVDETHPLAQTASGIIARVQLANSASAEPDSGTAFPLCIGLDGTFSAGVLRGRVPGADDPSALPLASHIGARQRRAAALARAAQLDEEAEKLEAQANEHDNLSTAREREAADISALGGTVPSRTELRAAESHRAALSRIAAGQREKAHTRRSESERAARDLERAFNQWLERTRGRGLPGELDRLAHLRDDGSANAATLRAAAAPLEGKLAERLDRVAGAYSAEDFDRALIQAEMDAQEAFRVATDAQVEVRLLEEMAGAAIEEVLGRHDRTQKFLSALRKAFPPAQDERIRTASAQATATSVYSQAERKLQEETVPNAAQRLRALRGLLDVPGVQEAVLHGRPCEEGVGLLRQVETALRARRTLTVKTVLERVDAARAQLAGIWALDPGDNHGKLLTYVLTYRDATYTPIEAAAHAQTLKARAEQALAASEERALREFVIGRLPSAIGTAWVRLQDWVSEVNRKMRAAAASSGVGVQVRVPLREDLSPAARAVYELSCEVSSAERSEEQERRLGTALQSLLTSVQGDAMRHRVATAVDIREWVEVQYEVTRPGGTKQRWSAKTGLSGGERRLVVLAPMLAAVAAAYDRFGGKALRIVSLDEVPVEVDERGREGLARYLGELDLDLICTSYLWDGCPGAWDGIDAHDLEAAGDGTVVAFPMLVRGVSPIPEVTTLDGKILPLERLQ